jgi:hypothetical protein
MRAPKTTLGTARQLRGTLSNGSGHALSVVLDLFDRRLAVFHDVDEAAKAILNATSGSERQAPFWRYIKAEANARFLFGQEIIDLLAERRKDIAAIMSFSDIRFDHPEYAKLIDRMQIAQQNLAAFVQNSAESFAPYMRLDQKMRSLWWPTQRSDI